MKPILQRWDALKRGLYSKPTVRVGRGEVVDWMQDRLGEIEQFAGSFSSLTTGEFGRAWGALGEPGDADAIISTSQLFAELCETALEWEERVRFTAVEPAFEPARAMLVGVAGTVIDEGTKLPAFLSGVLENPEASGNHSLYMVVKLPDDWVMRFQRALHQAKASLGI